MKIIIASVFCSLILNASSPFETPKAKKFDLSVFNSEVITQDIAPTDMVQCHVVCDKKIYNLNLLKSAISFYKNSKNYRFDGSSYK